MLSVLPHPRSTPERLLVVLEALALEGEGLSFSEVRERLGGVPAVTVTRTLQPLLATGFAEKGVPDGRYRVGRRMRALLRSANDIASLEERVEPVLQRLAEGTGHSAAYFHWDGDWAYVRARAEVAESFHYAAIGHRKHPASHTFLRAIFAQLNAAERRRIGAELSGEDRKGILRRGYDLQTEWLRFAIFRITAPVFYGEGGAVAGSLGITSLVLEFSRAERASLAHAVVSAAHEASRQFATLPPT